MPPLCSMLQDGDNGSLSSKRVVTFLAFIFCSIAFFANLFFGMEVKDYMFEGMMVIAVAGLGVTVTEKFARRSTYRSEGYENFTETKEYRHINRTDTGGTKLPKQYDREL